METKELQTIGKNQQRNPIIIITHHLFNGSLAQFFSYRLALCNHTYLFLLVIEHDVRTLPMTRHPAYGTLCLHTTSWIIEMRYQVIDGMLSYPFLGGKPYILFSQKAPNIIPTIGKDGFTRKRGKKKLAHNRHMLYLGSDSNRHGCYPLDFESNSSTNFDT